MRVSLAAHLYSRPMLYRLLRFEYFRFALAIGFYKQESKGLTMYPAKKRELRHDRHTVSLLTDHTVFAPKLRGKILTGDVAMVAEGIICKTCRSLSYIAKKIKGVSSKRLRDEFPHLKEWCGDHLWAPSCFHVSAGNGWDVVSRYIETQDAHHAKNAIYRPRP